MSEFNEDPIPQFHLDLYRLENFANGFPVTYEEAEWLGKSMERLIDGDSEPEIEYF